MIAPAETWRDKLRAARQMALDSMTPDEREQVQEARRLARARSQDRRSKTRLRVERINHMIAAGLRPAEIIAAENISLSEFARLRIEWGIHYPARVQYRRVNAWVHDSKVPILDAVAAGAGKTREDVVKEILEVALSDGGLYARRWTGLKPRAARS